MKPTKRECVKCGYAWMTKRIDELYPECEHSEDIQQHCGHPVSKIVTGDEGTCYCSSCEEESRFEQWLDAEAKEFFNAGGFGLASKFKDAARKAFAGSWKKNLA